MTRKTQCSKSIGDLTYLEGPVENVISFFNNLKSEAGENATNIRIDCDYGWEMNEFSLMWDRPETKDEEVARERKKKRDKEKRNREDDMTRNRELDILRKLKEKYPECTYE